MINNTMQTPRFMPWLFDNKDAWERTISDPRYRYDMKFDLFMKLYQEHRNKKKESNTLLFS